MYIVRGKLCTIDCITILDKSVADHIALIFSIIRYLSLRDVYIEIEKYWNQDEIVIENFVYVHHAFCLYKNW